jgi:hypothetical protein
MMGRLERRWLKRTDRHVRIERESGAGKRMIAAGPVGMLLRSPFAGRDACWLCGFVVADRFSLISAPNLRFWLCEPCRHTHADLLDAELVPLGPPTPRKAGP